MFLTTISLLSCGNVSSRFRLHTMKDQRSKKIKLDLSDQKEIFFQLLGPEETQKQKAIEYWHRKYKVKKDLPLEITQLILSMMPGALKKNRTQYIDCLVSSPMGRYAPSSYVLASIYHFQQSFYLPPVATKITQNSVPVNRSQIFGIIYDGKDVKKNPLHAINKTFYPHWLHKRFDRTKTLFNDVEFYIREIERSNKDQLPPVPNTFSSAS